MDYWELDALALHICGVDENADVDNVLCAEFECSMETFEKIISKLLPMIQVSKSDLTGNCYRGFGANGRYIIKQEVNS